MKNDLKEKIKGLSEDGASPSSKTLTKVTESLRTTERGLKAVVAQMEVNLKSILEASNSEGVSSQAYVQSYRKILEKTKSVFVDIYNTLNRM